MRRLLFAAVAATCLSSFAANERVLLLTGFEPFGGSKFNTSWDIVSSFEGQTIGDLTVHCVRLPVVYDAIEEPLRAAIARLKPEAVVSFGEGTPTLQIETAAKNGYSPFKPHDNLGHPPPRSEIIPGGRASIPTGLPVSRIVEALYIQKHKIAESKDAGGYLCNECFYRLMSEKDAPKVRGFVHVPVIKPDQVEERKDLKEKVWEVLAIVEREATEH